MTASLPLSVRSAVLDALALVLPVDCAGCGRPDRALCADCRRAVQPDGVLRRELSGVGTVTAGRPYDGPARQVLLAAKEHDRLDVLPRLAPALAAAVSAQAALLPPGTVVCPVPTSPRARRRRGVDPVRVLLARAGVPAGRLLLDRGSSAAQKSLGLAARRANAAGRMRARRRLDGTGVLLVDDVCTTGATLQEAARAVREAGGEVLGAAVALSTGLRGATVGASSGLPGDNAGSRDYGGPKGVEEMTAWVRRAARREQEVEHGHHHHRQGGRHS
jgi:predicted amidophosphoribosyltransferase